MIFFAIYSLPTSFLPISSNSVTSVDVADASLPSLTLAPATASAPSPSVSIADEEKVEEEEEEEEGEV